MSTALHARYRSVDAMRGLTVAAMLVVNNPGDWAHVYAPLPHTKWNGCSIADFVFPFFLFLVGVSISLYNTTEQEKDTSHSDIYRRILVRSAKLILAGLLLNGVMMWTFHTPHYFLMGTLQRIGLCYLVAAWTALYTSSSTQWALIAALLIGYAMLLVWGGSYAPFTNMSDRIDNLVLGVHAVITDPVSGAHRDPDGLLSTLGAMTTTLLGIRAGDWLRDSKTRHLYMAGLTLIVVGYAWSYGVPINKKMWTGPFVLWTGGWAMLGLGLYHELIDRHQWPALGRTLGINAITAYIGSLLVFLALYRFGWWQPFYQHVFASWLTPISGPYLASLCYAIAFTGMAWLVLKGMDQRGWRLRF